MPGDPETGADDSGPNHRFDPGAGAKLEEVERYRYLSRDELVAALDPEQGDVVADVGSGTGFYTREVAPYVGSVLAVDLQSAMHRQFTTYGVPANVSQILARDADLPLRTGSVDAAYSTMTFHEYELGGIDEIHRVLRPGGRLVVVDWSATGTGERGPPLEGRVDLPDAVETVERAGFKIESARDRPETFLIEAATQ